MGTSHKRTAVMPWPNSEVPCPAPPPPRYCNKGCLQDAIDRGWLRESPGGPVSLVKVVVTATEVAAGMASLHRADVVHGDLSPYNVLLSG